MGPGRRGRNSVLTCRCLDFTLGLSDPSRSGLGPTKSEENLTAARLGNLNKTLRCALLTHRDGQSSNEKFYLSQEPSDLLL